MGNGITHGALVERVEGHEKRLSTVEQNFEWMRRWMMITAVASGGVLFMEILNFFHNAPKP